METVEMNQGIVQALRKYKLLQFVDNDDLVLMIRGKDFANITDLFMSYAKEFTKDDKYITLN